MGAAAGQDNAYKEILDLVTVSHQDVVIAKSFIVRKFRGSTKALLAPFMAHVGDDKPENVVIHESVELDHQLKRVAAYLGWQMAFGEAVWGLIGSSVLVLGQNVNLDLVTTNQGWTNVILGGSGTSSSWTFDQFSIAVPAHLRQAPSRTNDDELALSNGDLFLAELDIPNLGVEISGALVDAVRCFRNDLYLPSLAMLGLASEGSWIELGVSLLDYADAASTIVEEYSATVRDRLHSRHVSVPAKIDEVVTLYGHADVFADVIKRSGHKAQALGEIVNWSNVVRDSRNAIHYGTDAAVENSYEKVAILLLGCKPYLGIIYRIKDAADSLTG
ncbi:MAG: hypothetical protein J4N74_08355 [Chloroflexi bacterium]|nr:hypothetical protein [Chloroflexota bacterium]MCI0891396.1 hypothetical protein [Chloroflexota bacterium]